MNGPANLTFVNTSSQDGCAGRSELADEEIKIFANAMLGEPVPPFLPSAIRRTDGRFRQILFETARAGAGADGPLVRLDCLKGVACGNPWDGRCGRLPDVGHAASWEAPTQTNAVLEPFLDELD